MIVRRGIEQFNTLIKKGGIFSDFCKLFYICARRFEFRGRLEASFGLFYFLMLILDMLFEAVTGKIFLFPQCRK